ncbi:dioxygenase family protein [Limnoglobus roseus]|uniref:Intradiol ring-cleavage dioxygenase n=1 Tax=Limnoglobus roseus TaxID=2598579 RepID=A0A5C1AJ39_9BACT|nr:twin-arginine translocation pathway signal protein [Limnoglobus roseus]QEL18016.1 intradiol ring-cleavage dioxygenase [Limnoglobus roseus]
MSKQTSREDREWTRREMFIKSAYATFFATGLLKPGIVFAASNLTQTPGVTEGPYWVDSMPNRSDVRANSTAGSTAFDGYKTNLAISVSRLANNTVTPIANAKVDIWHTNGAGKYSAIASEGTTGQNFCRGYQLTDKRGGSSFTTIFPGWYSGRTPHIHFRVRLYSGTTVTYNFVSQLFSAEAFTNQVYATTPYSSRPNRDTTNSTDMVYKGASQGVGATVSSEVGQYLLMRQGKNSTQITASFNVVLVA